MAQKAIWLFVTISLLFVPGNGLMIAWSDLFLGTLAEDEYCFLVRLRNDCYYYRDDNGHYIEGKGNLYKYFLDSKPPFVFPSRFGYEFNSGLAAWNTKILRADKDGFKIVIDSGGWRKFEMSSERRYPRLYFESEEEKAKMKQALMEEIADTMPYSKREQFYYLRYFPDYETKYYLLQILLRLPEEPEYRKVARTLLREIVKKDDRFIAKWLHQFLEKKHITRGEIMWVISVLEVLKVKSSLLVLDGISKNNKYKAYIRKYAGVTYKRILDSDFKQ